MADGMLQGYESLRRRISAIEGPNLGKPLMRDLGLAAIREIGMITPHKTGNLRRSLDNQPREVTDTSAKIGMSANYALFVEEDTRAHDITPNAKKALRWASAGGRRLSGAPTKAAQRGGGLIFAKRVHHPGTKGQHMMTKGAEKAMTSSGAAAIGARVVRAWDDAR